MSVHVKKKAASRGGNKATRAIMISCPNCGRVHLVSSMAGGGRSVKINNSIYCDCGVNFRFFLRVGKNVSGKICTEGAL
jgi:hypothetical protein